MNRKPEKWNDIGKYLPTREDLEVRRLLPIAIEDIQEQAREILDLRSELDQAQANADRTLRLTITLGEREDKMRQERDRLRDDIMHADANVLDNDQINYVLGIIDSYTQDREAKT